MNLNSPRVVTTAVLAAALFLAGCSTTDRVVTQWSNPAYTSPSFKKIMVGGGVAETAVRRNFEDEFVAQLRTAGLDGLPSYRYIPEDQIIDEVKLKQAAKHAGADAAIFARPVSVEQKTEYRPNYYPSPSFGIFGPHAGAAWYGLYSQPRIRRYDVYTSEATLYDLGKNEVVWTGTIRTNDPDNVDSAIKSYVASLVKALKQKNFLPPAN